MTLLWIAPQVFYSARGTPMNVRRLAEAIAGAGHSTDLVTYGFGDDVPLPPSVRIVRAGRLPFVGHGPIGRSLVKILLDVRVVLLAGRLFRSPRPRRRVEGTRGSRAHNRPPAAPRLAGHRPRRAGELTAPRRHGTRHAPCAC